MKISDAMKDVLVGRIDLTDSPFELVDGQWYAKWDAMQLEVGKTGTAIESAWLLYKGKRVHQISNFPLSFGADCTIHISSLGIGRLPIFID